MEFLRNIPNPKNYFHFLQDLKSELAALIPEQQSLVKEFRSKHGDTVVGNVTVDMVSHLQTRQYGGSLYNAHDILQI